MPKDILIIPGQGRIDFTGESSGSIRLEVGATGSVSFLGATGPIVTLIDSSTGRVGIGTTGPGYVLDVFGDAGIGGSLNLTSDPNATTQSTAVIRNTTANGGIALVPNGTGAITVRVPDGLTTGGNARGQYAVDLQISPLQYSNNVASGNYSVLLGGQYNRATGSHSFAGGGTFIIPSGQYSAVVGGNTNTASGTASFIGGGQSNSNSSSYGTISGGQSNTASTGTHATVVGGRSNTSSGQYSVSGGFSNVASGQGSVALGYDNTASGDSSVAMGSSSVASGAGSFAMSVVSKSTASGPGSFAMGRSADATNDYTFAFGQSVKASGLNSVVMGGSFDNPDDGARAYGDYSVALGRYPYSYLYGQFTYTSGSFGQSYPAAQTGHSQMSFLVPSKIATLTTGATTTLSLDGTGTTNLIIPDGNNRAWNVKVETIAVVTLITGTATGVSVGDSFLQNDTVLFKRIGGTSSVVGSSNNLLISDNALSTASMNYSAGASQELALTFQAPTFAGGGSVTFRVVSKVSLVEVAY